jgi:hypothetical protein
MSKTMIISFNEEENLPLLITNLDIDNLAKYVLDLSLDQDLRINALEQLCELEKENSVELISKITGMYQFSGTTILARFLYKVCTHGNITAFLKLELATSLLSFVEIEEDSDSEDEDDMIEIKRSSNIAIQKRNLQRKNNGYKALDSVCYDLQDVPTPCRIDAICMLMKCETYKNQSQSYFIEIINDQFIDCDFRYKTILSLENKNITHSEFFIKNSCLKFIFENKNRTMYRILSGQYLLQKCEINDTQHNNVQTIIMSFAEDSNLDYDLRADAADMLLSLGSVDIKIKAKEIIILLGRAKGYVKTIFDNAQNVHTNEVEESVQEILEMLAIIPVLCINKTSINFEYVCNQIKKELEIQKNKKKNDDKFGSKNCKYCYSCTQDEFCEGDCIVLYERDNKIQIALNRIYMDRVLYSKFNNTLSNILLKIWTYIHEHENQHEMKERLIQELNEMSGTCSTGFVSRLVNVISGFGEYNLRISWEDQIVANFSGRLNAKARNITTQNSIFYNSKSDEVVQLWINKNINIKKEVIDILTASSNSRYRCSLQALTEQPTMKQIVKKYLQEFRNEKIETCVSDFCECVLNEMMLPPSQFANRQNFLLFFRSCMLSIREELYEEFKDHIIDSDFDLYIRKAIMVYEGENY